MHDTLFAWQDSIGVTSWQSIAAAAGVRDLGAYRACLTDTAAAARVNDDREAARKLGATGTPTVLVNGVRFGGVPRKEQIDSMVHLALRTKD